jgi:hypothetical protein
MVKFTCSISEIHQENRTKVVPKVNRAIEQLEEQHEKSEWEQIADEIKDEVADP